MTESIIEVEDLVKFFPVKIPVLQRILTREPPVVHAVDGVSFALPKGEVFGLVGESGCGKTTVGRTVLRLLEPTSGTIRFEGTDVTHLKEALVRPLRQAMQIIFQDPHASLNPAMTIGQSIGDPVLIHGISDEAGAKEAALQIMTEVGLSPADQLYAKYPADLSGGQKQRAVIARAMILKPKFVVADEPVAMLDMSIRAKILELMLELKGKYGLTYLFITHDLATAKFICDRIAIMYLGRIVESGDAKEIFREPKHPYTQALLAAIPSPDPDAPRLKALPRGEVPDAIHPPAGCRFHPRCPVATPTCGWEPADVFDVLDRRALDETTRKRDEEVLGPRERMTVAGPTLHVRAIEAGLSPRGRRVLGGMLLLGGLAFLPFSVVAGVAVWATGVLSLAALHALARRDAFRTDRVAQATERLRAHLEAVLRSGPPPLAEAIRKIDVVREEVRVEFAPAADPGLRKVDGREVRCVLY